VQVEHRVDFCIALAFDIADSLRQQLAVGTWKPVRHCVAERDGLHDQVTDVDSDVDALSHILRESHHVAIDNGVAEWRSRHAVLDR
jgi:hypothetical protein